MKIAISGSTGLIGSSLGAYLLKKGHGLSRLVRFGQRGHESDIYWNPATQEIERDRIENFDGVVHLAGENILSHRWNVEQKSRIRDSRVNGTRILSEALAQTKWPPQVLIAASAIGFYGDRGDEWVDESSPSGQGFLAGVCRDWEGATEPAKTAGIRVVNLRIGIVLSAGGGALPRMAAQFRLGLGGPIGAGRQYMSWITIDDVARAIEVALHSDAYRGPVNATSPHPVTNKEFATTLARVMDRPALFRVPASVLRLSLGEVADEVLLSGARVAPKVLMRNGYEFLVEDLELALRHSLASSAGGDLPTVSASGGCSWRS